MRHHLHMPSYFLGTFTEYPYPKPLSEKAAVYARMFEELGL